MNRFFYGQFLLVLLFLANSVQANDDQVAGWKAGVAVTVITPEENIWMAGYGGRTRPADGKIHDLWAKALALEDSLGNRSVLVTLDLLGLSKPVSDRIREGLASELNLTKARMILNASHTHSGPVLADALTDIYPGDIDKDKGVSRYTAGLESKIVELVTHAFQDMFPAELYAENGVARFQVNRRNNNEQNLVQQTELKGPNDYAVPVIKVADLNGNIRAIVFGYACHATTLSGYEWCGDYPGFAQIELEKTHPGAVALFFQGACADQNPLPRRTVPLAKQHGLTLAAAVDRVLQENMRKLSPVLLAAYTEIDLPLTTPPTQEELAKIAGQTQGDYNQRWAARLLEEMAKGQAPIRSYPYPLQVWNIGEQPLISLGGELVVEYAIGFKRMFGQDIFVMGYSNDVPAYIPSITILREGGYEGDSSQRVYGMPCKWSEDIEPLIYQEIKKLASSVGVKEK